MVNVLSYCTVVRDVLGMWGGVHRMDVNDVRPTVNMRGEQTSCRFVTFITNAIGGWRVSMIQTDQSLVVT